MLETKGRGLNNLMYNNYILYKINVLDYMTKSVFDACIKNTIQASHSQSLLGTGWEQSLHGNVVGCIGDWALVTKIRQSKGSPSVSSKLSADESVQSLVVVNTHTLSFTFVPPDWRERIR